MEKKRILFIGVAGVFVSLILIFLVMFCQRLYSAGEIIIDRNGQGEGSKEVELYLEDDEILSFTVEEQEYEEDEVKEVLEKGFSKARKEMLLDNESADNIVSSLSFMSELPGGIRAQWISSDEEVLSSDGTVHNEEWEETREEMVMVTLILSCQGETQTEQVYLRIKAPHLSEKEKRLQKIRKLIKQTEEDTRNKESFSLPSTMEGIRIRQEPPLNLAGVFVIVVAILFLFFYREQSQKKEEQKKRQKELLLEYPVFVHKMVLYLGAGLSVKSSFETMLEKYRSDLENGRGKRGVVYEELYVTMNEIGAGIGEKSAYEAFGNQLNENQYTRFIALLLQNMEKGNEGLIKSIAKEEENAFTNRLDQAKKAGEEAGTKLLFPMLLLLIVVMMIVMAPAMFQFQSY